MIKPLVWIEPGMVIIYGYSLDAVPHHHHAIQVIFPKSDSLCLLDEQTVCQPLIIDANIEHQLQMDEGWILLIEPKSRLGEALSLKLAGSSFLIFNMQETVLSPLPIQGKKPPPPLNALLQQLKLPQQDLFINNSTVADKRIQILLTQLDQCLQGQCLKPINWRASEIAQQLALSESRFLHLFKEQLGIAWRPYLLWRRMICAIQAILNDSSATDAAHLAGFSDSAHLSRTFKNNFGMSIRQAHILLKKG